MSVCFNDVEFDMRVGDKVTLSEQGIRKWSQHRGADGLGNPVGVEGVLVNAGQGRMYCYRVEWPGGRINLYGIEDIELVSLEDSIGRWLEENG